jgi:hypothetical protein
MKLLLACLAVVGFASLSEHVHGSIHGFNRLSIDFTKQEDAAAKATWSRPDKLAITAQGLGWDGPAAESIKGWIQTKPHAVGLSWRPASSVSLNVTIEPTPKPMTLNSGETSTPYTGTVYARFSPDAKHWSTWQALNTLHPIPKDSNGRLFTGALSVPMRERAEYLGFFEAYSKLDVPWTDDEEAMVKWILARDARFFERSLPFIGYVEFLFEVPFHGGRRVASLKADVGYGMSGLHSKAKDTNAALNRDVPWRFKSP